MPQHGHGVRRGHGVAVVDHAAQRLVVLLLGEVVGVAVEVFADFASACRLLEQSAATLEE